MPGLSLHYDPHGRTDLAARFERVVERARHATDYLVRPIVATRQLRIVASGFPEYPVAVREAGRYTAILEGRTYDGAADAAVQLLALAPAALGGDGDDRALARWLGGVDGDLLAMLIDRTSERVLIGNDRYGRLPVYWAAGGDGVVVSRELGVVAASYDPARLVPRAVAEFLVFGYPLGTSTLFGGVQHLPPASTFAVTTQRVTTHAVHDFDRDDRLGVPAGEVADRLASALVAASLGRTRPDRKTLVSLSGGLDSRIASAALLRGGIRPEAVTHVGPGDAAAEEAVTAGHVAERLGIPWRCFPVDRPRGAQVERLLRLKRGANYLGMTRVLAFLDAVANRYGRGVVFFTGDQGDRILGDVTPVVRLRNEDELVKYILRKESILPADAVARATGVPRRAIEDAIRERLATYPERSLAQRYVHFLFYERAVRWLFEGEDRNRSWFWSVTPFYAPAVFELAMAVPGREKAGHRLRLAVLRALSPDALTVGDVTTGALGTPAFDLRQRLAAAGRRALYHTLDAGGERRLKRWVRRPDGYSEDSPLATCVRRQMARAGDGAVLDPAGVEALLAEGRGVRREQFSVLFTVSSLMDEIHGGDPVLRDFHDVPLV